MALPMAGCAAVLQGAPRARPTGRPMSRTWASAPQKSARPGAWQAKGMCFAQGLSPAGGSEMACERGVLRTCLSDPKARPSTVKGLAILAFLSFSLPVAARFFAPHLPMGGALAFRWCAHGARTAKLLRTWPCAEHWLSGGLALGGERPGDFHIPFPSNHVATRSPISWQRSWSSRLVSSRSWSG